MAEVIRMPRLSDTMEEGNIIGWLKKVGDSVAPGDILAEVETDKATMELESFHEGTLLYIGVEEGLVPVDGVLAIIGEKDEDYKSILEEATKNDASSGAAAQESIEPETAEAVSGNGHAVERRPVPSEMLAESAAISSIIKASPLAKSMATQKGIDLSHVQGTGDGGRIIKRDIENYLENKPSSPTTIVELPKPQLSPEINYGRQNLSQMRKVIARRLGESKFSAPHFYLTIEINMDKSVEAREEINEISEIRISFNDIIVKACAIALRKHPAVNSSWMEDHIMVHEQVNVGVAVAIGEGLLVPVIRNADLKSFSMINTEVKALAAKARDRKLQPEEMQGNTFTVSNLGMFDIEEFTAIINPPDACILAVGSIIEKPIVKNGEIVVGKMMKVTMSCDHRVVDGVIGAQFLQTLKSLLENPVRLLA